MYIILISLLVALDQITKYFALNYLSKIESITIIPNIFKLTYVENRGAAFGILQNQKYFFVIAAVLVCGFMIYYLITSKNLNKYSRLALILICAGAIGNLIDRIRLGFVVDYFDFIIWPVFNVADICVVIGGILLSLTMIFTKE